MDQPLRVLVSAGAAGIGAAVEGDRERCLAAGMDDYLTKPISPAAVAAMLEHWVPTR